MQSGPQDSSLGSNPSFWLRLLVAFVEKGFESIGIVPEVDPKISTDVTELLIVLSVNLAENFRGETSEMALDLGP